MTYPTTVNMAPLTPLSLLRRSAGVFPTRPAVIYADRRWSYGAFFDRVCRMANGLLGLGLTAGSRVAVLAPNVPPLLEAHFGIPMADAVIVAINTRLAGREVAYILDHSQAEVLLIDRGWLPLIEPIWPEVKGMRRVIVYDDPHFDYAAAGEDTPWRPENWIDYEAFLAGSAGDDPRLPLADEHGIIAIDYTSGTTGRPKGVMYTHRAAYLNAVCDLVQNGLSHRSVYLWTLPMFHCNGWCFTWGVPGVGAASVCLRSVDGAIVRDLIRAEGVTHFCGAPVVLQFLANLPEAESLRFENKVHGATGGAPPSPALIAAMQRMNVEVTHLYGLTETYGPFTVCEVQDEWLTLPLEDYAQKVARQGVANLMSGELALLDENNEPVPADGQTMGELAMRGNMVMKGYFRDEEATAHAFRGGWFHSGDLGVLHPDGYFELRDRANDIIISGGENISTVEVENTLAGHPAVQEVAVVSRPDATWGEVPVAFVLPKDGRNLTAEEVIAFCRERLAHFKCPREVVFEALPRTSTGKVQKFLLRERMWAGESTRIKGA